MTENNQRKSINTPREHIPLIQTTLNHLLLSSQSKTFANLFITIVGAGVLGLHYTFKKTGWFTSLVTIFGIAGLVYHGMMLLVHTRRKLKELLSTNQGLTYQVASFGDMGFTACGPIGRVAVDCDYYISISILYRVPHFYWEYYGQFVQFYFLRVSAKSMYIWGCFSFQLGLNSIRTLTHLAPLSIFVDIVQFGSMRVVLVQDDIMINQETRSVHAFGSISTFFYDMAIAIYTFEGIGMVLPLNE